MLRRWGLASAVVPLVLLFLTLQSTAQQLKSPTPDDRELKPDQVALIILERSGGVTDTSYRIELSNDNCVLACKGNLPRKAGNYKGKVDAQEWTRVSATVADGVNGLSDAYGEAGGRVDAAVCTLTLKGADGAAIKCIVEYTGVTPPELWRLQTIVDGVANRIDWAQLAAGEKQP